MVSLNNGAHEELEMLTLAVCLQYTGIGEIPRPARRSMARIGRDIARLCRTDSFHMFTDFSKNERHLLSGHMTVLQDIRVA